MLAAIGLACGLCESLLRGGWRAVLLPAVHCWHIAAWLASTIDASVARIGSWSGDQPKLHVVLIAGALVSAGVLLVLVAACGRALHDRWALALGQSPRAPSRSVLVAALRDSGRVGAQHRAGPGRTASIPSAESRPRSFPPPAT